MTNAHSLNPDPRPSGDGSSAPSSSVPTDRVGALRGSAAVGVQSKFWVYAGAVAVVVLGVVMVVSFISAAADNARIERMRTHGIAVAVKVVDCVGNLGGSGSNGAGDTCHGSYKVGATTYHEVIGSMSNFAAPGTSVRAIADPSKPSTIELASVVGASKPSNHAYIAPGLLALFFLLLAGAYVRLARRSRARDTA